MNGIMELVAMLVIATTGGCSNGILHYSGNIMPRQAKKSVPAGNDQTKVHYVLMLGVVGNTLLGTLSGLLVYMFISWNSPILEPFPHGVIGAYGILAFFGGFSGTYLIDRGKDWFEKQAIGALLPQMGRDDPDYPVVQNLIDEPRTSVAMMRLK